LLSSSRCEANRSAGTITYVSPFGFDASAGIIDVFAARELGYFRDMCLNVDVVTNGQMPTELVSSGRATVSNIGSAADDLAQVAGGADVVAVATYGDTSDYAILTQPGITNLKQLEGGTFGYHSTLPVAILEMFHAAGVDVSKVQEVDTQDYDPNQLVEGRENALQAYQSNEPLVLRAEHAQFNEFVPSQFGVKGTFNVQIFNARFLALHEQAVRDFMRAELHAFDYCVAHPKSCIEIEERAARTAGSVYDVSHEEAVWNLESALALRHTLPGMGVGVESKSEWEPEATALRQYGIVKSSPPLSKWEDSSIVEPLYNGKTLIWP
jgi:NitT/TauT family transport system substrate-binding protein